MEKAPFDRRQKPRHQPQQQPQQHAHAIPAGKQDSPRETWQSLSRAQARKQSGKL